MEVNKITNAYMPVQNKIKARSASESKEAKADKIEISNEARILQSQNTTPKNLEEIQRKIKENFYNSDEVLNKTANAILKEISKK